MHEARVTHLGPGLVVGQLGPVCVALWRDRVDLPRFQKQAEGLAATAASFPRGCAFVCVVEPTCEPPDNAMRQRSVALMDQHESQLACIAMVIEGSGFRPAIARSVLSGMALLLRSRVPRSFLSNMHATAAWVGRHVTVDGRELEAAVERWRASLPPPSSTR